MLGLVSVVLGLVSVRVSVRARCRFGGRACISTICVHIFSTIRHVRVHSVMFVIFGPLALVAFAALAALTSQ